MIDNAAIAIQNGAPIALERIASKAITMRSTSSST